MSLIGSVFERKRSGSVKPNAPSVAGRKTGFPPVQHRSKSAFARGRDDARKGDATTSRQVAPPPVIQRNADAEDWREQISRENETRVENMSESERQEEINEIMQRFGSGVGDILRKAKEARQKNTKDELDPVPLTSPTLEERKSPLKRVGSPPPALSTSSTRPSSRAENRKLRFAELTPDDVHVYESAPPSPRKKGPLLLLPPPDSSESTEDKPISLGTWTQSQIKKSNNEPEEGTPEYIRRRYFPQVPPNDPSLAWIEEDPSSTSTLSLRFDLTGTPIPASQSSLLPTHLGLHHHAEGSRAGYTLDDIFLLTRSTVPAQRTVMLGVLAGIARWLVRLLRDQSASNGLDVTDIRGKEEELRRRILAAGINALNERGSPAARAVDVIWECLVGWEANHTDNRVVEWERRRSSRLPSSEATKSVISTLSLDFLLPKISEIFALGALPQESLIQLLGIVHRLGKENNSIADSIVTTPKLLANVVQKFLLSPSPTSTNDTASDEDSGPQPLALELLITLASASRTSATSITELADTLLRFITTLPSASPFGSQLATSLLSLTIRLYKTLASYGLYASIATTAYSHFNLLQRYILSCSANQPAQKDRLSLCRDYLMLLEGWIVCATDPHRTTPAHEILWSQVVGWGWKDDILEFRDILEAGEEEFSAWAALWNAQAAWVEGSKVNAVRGGTAEREDAIAALKDGFSQELGKERLVISLAANRMRVALAESPEPNVVWLEEISNASLALSAALRLWVACAPPLSEGPMEEPHLILPFSLISDVSANLVNHVLWSWSSSLDIISKLPPYLLVYFRPLTDFLRTYLQVSRRLPDVTDDLWLAQSFTILGRMIQGDEEYALEVVKDIACAISRDFMSAFDVPTVIWERGGLSILQPFLCHMVRPKGDVYIGPLHPSIHSISASTTQRLASAATAFSCKSETTGLPLDRDWAMSPLDHLLRSGSSTVFQNLPPSWDASETEVTRSTLLLAMAQQNILPRYKLDSFTMSREEAVFGCMKVFMLEHGQLHSDSSDEVFRDREVGKLMDSLLKPYTLSASNGLRKEGVETGDLEEVAVRFLGPGTPFYQYYQDFVGLYDAISFSHPTFARLLLPPTSMRYPLDYRKHIWSDYSHILKNIRPPVGDIISGSLREYLYPVERDTQLITAYLRALVKGDLENASFLRKVAVHHIACNVWDDSDDNKSVKLLKAVVVQGGPMVVKAVVLYDVAEDGSTRPISQEIREKRLARLQLFGDGSLVERLRPLFES
ncbi:hypothetical protein PC9H_010425 [Pleurotus ostreatus]|uniref:RNA polymerase II-associated protein 1 C-terminal domain-containing protein n=2 Tax=Pleurotus TaxID=5320 RepID=A0A8H6ZM13_PLEOS|nr:uncharacterized protein PC9H_010425 [Pleurotus ostreatus]KAF7422269.1 hypothetical protein PC9H_010425 [Pleurotus ostreatus]KAG9227839.1 hypothetical protein CCMSSC00406_0008661 [Pleurotus cornucopiae]